MEDNIPELKKKKKKYMKGILRDGYSVLLMCAWALIISTLH